MDGISTPDLSRLESTGDDEDEDSDVMPDCSVTDPRYADWMRKQKGKGKAKVETRVVETPRTFSPFQQRLAKPHFEVKSQQQASCGPLVLGFAEGGRAVQIPAAINRFLRGYQRDGVKFFWKHYSEREGGLLGDDMGELTG
jgi:SNF2 family DNA or RNA helicase